MVRLEPGALRPPGCQIDTPYGMVKGVLLIRGQAMHINIQILVRNFWRRSHKKEEDIRRSPNLYERVRTRFAPLGGVDLDCPRATPRASHPTSSDVRRRYQHPLFHMAPTPAPVVAALVSVRQNCPHPFSRISRPFSRFQSRAFSVSRLSCSCFPRASAISIFARPFSLK